MDAFTKLGAEKKPVIVKRPDKLDKLSVNRKSKDT